MNAPHILIVDDDPVLLHALPQTISLRIPEAKIDITDSAQDALEQIRKYQYDTIVSDIKMPGMDGLELLARIRELRPGTPTLLVTGHGEHDVAIQALRGGAYDYILKPIDRDYFVAALRRAIQTQLLQRRVEEQQLALELHAKLLEGLVQQQTHELFDAHATKDKTIRIWNPQTGEFRQSLTGHTGRIECLAFSPDGKLLATGGGGGDTSVRLWDLGALTH